MAVDKIWANDSICTYLSLMPKDCSAYEILIGDPPQLLNCSKEAYSREEIAEGSISCSAVYNDTGHDTQTVPIKVTGKNKVSCCSFGFNIK